MQQKMVVTSDFILARTSFGGRDSDREENEADRDGNLSISPLEIEEGKTRKAKNCFTETSPETDGEIW